VEPATSVLNTDGRRILLPLLAAAVLVLLISCGNAAALLLVRGLQHRHEYGVRSAMGANRTALFKHVLGESLLLAMLGGTIGVALGAVVVALFKVDRGRRDPAARRGHPRFADPAVRRWRRVRRVRARGLLPRMACLATRSGRSVARR
jgi:ABC-type Fe3+ transport system permease subunit